jgi:hypothetical protein
MKPLFKTVPAVMDHMQVLQQELQSTKLANLLYFNLTYYIITKNVYAKIGKNIFDNDLRMLHVDVVFAQYYFDALKDYTENKNTTPAWEIAFDFYKKDTSIPLIYLALGVNAHVNNDLGLSVFDVVKHEDYKNDFEKINIIIYQSLDEVLTACNLPVYYKPFMNFLIHRWRQNAWDNYVQLKNKTKTKKQIENQAEKIAKALTNINSTRGFYRLYQVV